MTSVPQQFSLDKRTDAYWRITFNNPPINLINPETIQELSGIVDALEASQALNVVVFDSTNPDFYMARYDLARAAETPVSPGKTGLPMWIDLTTRLSRLAAISIACIRGRARGAGSEFALACDMRFASREKALLGQPEVAAGVYPGGGAIERLPDLVGRARALEIIVGSEDYDADLAERYGWINRSIADADLDGFVDQLARRIASFERPPLVKAKQLLNRRTLPDKTDLVESHDAFLTATRAPSAMVRGGKARALAKTVGLDFELRLGHYLGQI
jgi:enoyl-CoA hydratase/carnithine racemase